MSPQERRSRFARRLLTVVIACTLGSGFINLVDLGEAGEDDGVLLATLLLDAALVLAVAHMIVASIQTGGHYKVPGWGGAVVLLLCVYAGLFFLSAEPPLEKLLSVRSGAGYAMFGLYAHWLMSSDDKRQLLAFVLRASTVLAAFGIAQTALASRLPDWLLTPRDAGIFGYFGTDIVRSNGLVGNTVVFGAAMSLFYAVHLARWVTRPSWAHAATAALHLGAIYSTYSRVALVAAVVLGVVSMALVAYRRNPQGTLLRGGMAALTIPTMTWLLWPWLADFSEDLFVVSGLFGARNASVQASNEGHEFTFYLAERAFEESPWIGYGIGTQSFESQFAERSTIITDGALWAVLAEGGLILVATYALLLITTGFAAWRSFRHDVQNYAALGIVAFMLYQFTVASTYNSAIFGKAAFVPFWVLVGLATLRRGSDLECTEPLFGEDGSGRLPVGSPVVRHRVR